jgi:aldehyde dehydrogenase (NAD+)
MLMPEYEHRLLIDGELSEATGGARYDNINPADGSVVGSAADGQVADMERAIASARRAFDTTSWSMDHSFRRHCLEQLQSALREHAEDLRSIQTAEAGMTASVAFAAVDSVIENMSFMIGLADSYAYEVEHPTLEVMGMTQGRRVRREPFGVAGLISPWNAPFLTNIWKLTPALAAGNTAVLKGAPATPFSATTIGQIIVEKTDIPAGVVNIITSEDKASVGETLTGDDRVDVFHFTGSPGVGARIMERAAVGLRKVALELGGKSGNIVLDDADLDFVVPFETLMCTTLTGQGCALPTRLIVHESLYADAVERLRAAFEALPIGDPSELTTVIGPIINESQQQRILGLIETGIMEGATLATGGKVPKLDDRLSGGWWVEPTLFIDVDPGATIAQTEIFGPVLSVLRFGTDDEAVAIANSTKYGLAGFVQSADPERALAVGRRIRAGSIGINGTATWTSPDIPFGGYGISGLGREHGIEGFEEYLQTKAISYPA